MNFLSSSTQKLKRRKMECVESPHGDWKRFEGTFENRCRELDQSNHAGELTSQLSVGSSEPARV